MGRSKIEKAKIEDVASTTTLTFAATVAEMPAAQNPKDLKGSPKCDNYKSGTNKPAQ